MYSLLYSGNRNFQSCDENKNYALTFPESNVQSVSLASPNVRILLSALSGVEVASITSLFALNVSTPESFGYSVRASSLVPILLALVQLIVHVSAYAKL